MPLYWAFMPMLRASHATSTFQQQAAGAEDWTACADPVGFSCPLHRRGEFLPPSRSGRNPCAARAGVAQQQAGVLGERIAPACCPPQALGARPGQHGCVDLPLTLG